jgi:NADH:ubiquinone oxidoreductase subunit F (NADH-binding)
MSSSPTPVAQQGSPDRVPPPDALPRLLAGVNHESPLTLDEHLAQHGPPPRARTGGRSRARARAQTLIDEVERAGLVGCGGAAFSTARKLRAVENARGRAIVLVNAVEAEPPSFKDRTLLELAPHLVLDGAVLAAEAVGADAAILAVGEHTGACAASAYGAIEERARDRDQPPVSLTLASVSGGYVAGQETAVINSLEGGPAIPTFTPPMPFERGLRRRPTLVNNAETLAHLGLIARHGAPWFRQLGTASHPGSSLVTLAGPLAYPGVYEIENGASLSSLIDAAGGTTGGVRGALTGGYAGTWLSSSALSGLVLSREHLAAYGASFGAGTVTLLSQEACPVAEVVRLARWMADESAHQCGPCVHGLDALAKGLAAIASGRPEPNAYRRLETLAALSARRGACAHPDGSVRVISSALEAFADDFAEHARGGPCELCARPPELPLPARGTQAAARGAR